MLKLQVLDNGEWGTLNALAVGKSATPDAISRATQELIKMQSAWSANYDRFRGSDVKFRIAHE